MVAVSTRHKPQITNHWIEFKLQGSKGNRDGIGATLRITTSLGDQYATVTCGGSYQSSSDPRIHFEVGIDAMVKLVEIHWPSGVVVSHDVNADQILKVKEAMHQVAMR